MRDIGYSLDTALADIVDNSITAGAKVIRLLADTTSADPSLGIVDDGEGMDEEDLLKAMRLGSRSPLDTRDSTDLGRFGLGLKTASFSQCRRLTIVTRKGGVTSCARWDLDYVADTTTG
jgi:DNA mismatch repair ATPase MutL